MRPWAEVFSYQQVPNPHVRLLVFCLKNRKQNVRLLLFSIKIERKMGFQALIRRTKHNSMTAILGRYFVRMWCLLGQARPL